MNAEILSVGTELLLGDIVNTNAQYIARELANLGINVYFQTVVGDNEKRLSDAFQNAFQRADIVITTGGLGPTGDDLTKETAASVFGKKLLKHDQCMAELEAYFQKQNFEMTENNRKQAFLPEGSVPLKNNNGTAPGCYLEDNGKILIMLPGPPKEMEPMFNESVLPILAKKQEKTYISKVVKICGVGESSAENQIKDLLDSQTNPTIAPYAKQNEVSLRVTASAKSKEEAAAMIDPVLKELYSRFGENIYGEDEETLESVIGDLLVQKNLTLSVCESATGGMIASRLIQHPGISKVFLEGVVSYSNESKMKRLGVKEETLQSFGAVSQETAKEMAEGIAKTAGTDIGLSVTGIAGPDGGTDQKPVGLMYVGLSVQGKTTVKELKYMGSRERIRARTATFALDFLRREVLKLR